MVGSAVELFNGRQEKTENTEGTTMASKRNIRTVTAPCTGAQFTLESYFSLSALGLREYVDSVDGMVPPCWTLFIIGL